jgi:hypothetical protein
LQKFCITGTGAYSVWKLLSTARSAGLDENEGAVINILGFVQRFNEQEQQIEVDDAHYYGIEMLQPKTLSQLRIIWRGGGCTGFWNEDNSYSKNIVVVASGTMHYTSTANHLECTSQIMVHGSGKVKGLL